MNDFGCQNEALLLASLDMAVPLRLLEIVQENGAELRWSDFQERACELAYVIAEKGDIILFKSKKKGESAQAWAALVEALAILSLAPGGVKFMGLHWEADVILKQFNKKASIR